VILSNLASFISIKLPMILALFLYLKTLIQFYYNSKQLTITIFFGFVIFSGDRSIKLLRQNS